MTADNQSPNPKKYIKMRQLRKKLHDRARSSIYEDVKHGRLPKPMKLGGVNYWDESAVDEAMAGLAA